MRTGFLSLLIIFLLQGQAFALSRVLFCQQREMSPNENTLEVSGADPTGRDLKLYFAGSETKFFKVKDVDVSADQLTRALYQGAEMTLQVTRQVDRTYSGDVGYLAKLSGAQFSVRNMICWFSKQARLN